MSNPSFAFVRSVARNAVLGDFVTISDYPHMVLLTDQRTYRDVALGATSGSSGPSRDQCYETIQLILKQGRLWQRYCFSSEPPYILDPGYYAPKSRYRILRYITAICLSNLSSDALLVFVNDILRLFQSVMSKYHWIHLTIEWTYVVVQELIVFVNFKKPPYLKGNYRVCLSNTNHLACIPPEKGKVSASINDRMADVIRFYKNHKLSKNDYLVI